MNVNFNQEILIALGGNIRTDRGDVTATLVSAIKDLARAGLDIRRVGRFFSTPCFPPGAGPDYVNSAVVLRSGAPPAEILERLHRIEAAYGRTRETRWGQRTLDLDLLAVGDAVLPDRQTFDTWANLPAEAQIRATPDRLILPHPRLADRAFVLVPLADVAADWIHPVLGLSVAQMCAALPAAARAEVVALE